MARITVEDCLEKVSNRFALIHIAARRVRQLRKGAEPLIIANNSDNIIALREIAAGKVFMTKTLEQNESVEEATETEMQTPSEEINDSEMVSITQTPEQAEVVERTIEAQIEAPSDEIDDSEFEAPEEVMFDQEDQEDLKE